MVPEKRRADTSKKCPRHWVSVDHCSEALDDPLQRLTTQPVEPREVPQVPTPHPRNRTVLPAAARFLSRVLEPDCSAAQKGGKPSPQGLRAALGLQSSLAFQNRLAPGVGGVCRAAAALSSSPARPTSTLSRVPGSAASARSPQRSKLPGPTALRSPGPAGRSRPRARRLRPQSQNRAGVSIQSSTPLGNSPPGHTRAPLPPSSFRRQVSFITTSPRGLYHSSPGGFQPTFAAPLLAEPLRLGRRNPKNFGKFRLQGEGGAARAPPGRTRLFPCAAVAHSALGGAGWLPGCGSSVRGGCCCLWPGRLGEAECW